ncbi:MAG TPA: VOC family protein [Steroidobacteraceae bacterium]|jgi:catechol 2,3-dioxygenase-like lactoylglutathione lyase family enzyme|nr:VOC family protein [Steroidobacteraceae bacterium]
MKTLLNCHARLLAAALALLAGPTAWAAAAAPAAEVLAPGNFIHVVAHIDKTMAFYHGVLGLDALTLGNAPPRPPTFAANGPVAQLYAAPADTSVGVAMYRLPVMGVGLEFAEFRHVEQKSSHPRPQDPGASCVVLTVRQLDPILLRAHAAHVPIMSLGGVPVAADDPVAAGRSVVLSDPDGYYVELVEEPAATAAADSRGDSGNILQAALMLSIDDTDRNAHFYRDLLGLPLQIDAAFAPDAALSKAFGLRGGQVRHSVATIAGSSFKYDFVEWKGVPRRATHAGVHDHGASVLRFSVTDVDGLVSNLKTQGIVVDSTGDGVVAMGGAFRASILSDPNGLYIEPVPRLRPRSASARAPRPAQAP